MRSADSFGNALGNSIVGQIEETSAERSTAEINNNLGIETQAANDQVSQQFNAGQQAFSDQVSAGFNAQVSDNNQVAGIESGIVSSAQAGFSAPDLSGLASQAANIRIAITPATSAAINDAAALNQAQVGSQVPEYLNASAAAYSGPLTNAGAPIAGLAPQDSKAGFFAGAGYALFEAAYQPLATVYDLGQVGLETGRSLITGDAPRDIEYASALGQEAAGGATSGQLLTQIATAPIIAPFQAGYGLGSAIYNGDSYQAGESLANLGLVFGGAKLAGFDNIDVSPSAIGNAALNGLIRAADVIAPPELGGLPGKASGVTPTAILQILTSDANSRLIEDPTLAQSVLSDADYANLQTRGGYAPVYGKVIQGLVDQQIISSPELSSIFEVRGGPNQPDYVGVGDYEGLNFDITTPRGVPGHLMRPGYGQSLNITTYQRAPTLEFPSPQ